MLGTWIIIDNHVALQVENEILHPSASEVYEALEATPNCFLEDIECMPIREAFPEIHFSKVGSDVKCILENSNSNEIELRIVCIRRGKEYSIDVIEGQIIDQCVKENEWLYITGYTNELSELFKTIGVKSSGLITMAQYIKIICNDHNFGSNTLVNTVQINMLDKPISSDLDIPYGLKAKLYKYQKTGFQWMKYMLDENQGCILGDEMGLGKTLQVITIMLEYLHRKLTPMLVVAPVSLLENWKRECKKFAPSLDVYIHHGSKRTGRYKDLEKHDVIVISYNTAVSDTAMLSMIKWTLVILDEAQNIKNPDSERTKFVKKIPKFAGIAVSGTPFENHVTDIWSLVDFVIPGLLGTKNDYSNYITDDVEGADKIEPLLSPIMIRRMVRNVASDLPEKVVISQPIAMSETEARRYEDYRQLAQDSSENGNISLGVLQKLRMFCTHPQICEGTAEEDPYAQSVKYQRMCEILEEVISRNEKVILFTSYQKMFDILEYDIPNRFEIPVNKINGSTPVEERQLIVDEFDKYQRSMLLILNPRAAGTGLNITAANHVIHYNLEWNPALEDQASARAYRRGQEKTVFVYRLFYENTVEQIVNERIERKREIANVAIVGTDGSSENREDLIAAINISPLT